MLATGDPMIIRPIRPDDEAMMVRFHEGLSDLSVYLRYFHVLRLAQRTAHSGSRASAARIGTGRS